MKVHSMTRTGQRGFTIVELMIATAVFSVVLLLCATGLLQIGRSYYKGVTTARTQEVARSIIDEVAQSIQFSGGAVNPLTNNNGSIGYCVGGKRFSYLRDYQLIDPPQALGANQARHVMVVDEIPNCGAGWPAQDVRGGLTATSRELVSTRMRVVTFTITRQGATDLYEITVRVVSGENDILNAAHDSCVAGRAGTQFCAVSELRTVVQMRV
jgi:prepilin-type N-terminal cleavage/methylation domain-containing protein